METLEMLQNEEEILDKFNTSISHGIYVSNLAYFLGTAIGLDESACHELAIAGLLHDIGKIKASRLLYVEQEDHNLVVKQMNYLRTHPFLGFEILKREGYSEFIQESILFHHENFDGSGYPSNLSGDTIPIGARVLRICDVFAALTTRKGYRPAHDADSALDFMISDVKNFDMKIFLKFMNMINDRDIAKEMNKSLIDFNN
ncbi:MAG: HD domain-containing phosphohydrolase [Lachnospiraceae bacterium]|jgi:putative nucleotidyltransferase with HDIG domain